MKTKRIILLLCVTMLFALVACGEDKVSGTNIQTQYEENSSENTVSDSFNINDNQEQTDTVNSGLEDIIKIELDFGDDLFGRVSEQRDNSSLCYDYFSTYYIDKQMVSDILYTFNESTKQSDIMIGIYDGYLSNFNGTLEDVIDCINQGSFITDMSYSGAGAVSKGLISENIKVTSSEKVSVAGLDGIKFTGNITNKNTKKGTNESWECYCYGYNLIIDEVPYAVVGIIPTKEQEQSTIDKMIAEVDAIAPSLRLVDEPINELDWLGIKENINPSVRISRKLRESSPIYYNYSSDYYVNTVGNLDTILYTEEDCSYQMIIGFYDGNYKEFDGNLEDVIDFVNADNFLANLSNSRGVYSFESEAGTGTNYTRKADISGLEGMLYADVTPVLSELSTGDTWECNTYGYTFIIDEVPYAVIGIFVAKDQNPMVIDKMMTEVDSIAASIKY